MPRKGPPCLARPILPAREMLSVMRCSRSWVVARPGGLD